MSHTLVNWSRTTYRPVADTARERRWPAAWPARVQSRSRREHKRGREYEPHGEADPNRQSTAEEAAATRPAKPTAVDRSDRTRAGASGRTRPVTLCGT
jgi:hypothetical protein